METKELQQVKTVLAEILPELMTQALQSNKYELSGLHREINDQLKLLTENSIKNTGKISNIENHLITLNGKVATQEGRWADQIKINTLSENEIKNLKESEKTRTANEDKSISYWKDKAITAIIIIIVALLSITGVLNIPK